MGFGDFLRKLFGGLEPNCPCAEIFQLRQALEKNRRDVNY